MTLRFYINTLTIILCLATVLSAFGQKVIVNGIQVDTSKTAIIPFNKEKSFRPFDTTYKAAFLTQDDINNIDSLLIVAVSNHNNSVNKNERRRIIDLKKYNYKKQLITATNKNGAKQVWVNCFCSILVDSWKNKWKTDSFIVFDGGQCFFNFKIDLATLKVYDFYVNGSG